MTVGTANTQALGTEKVSALLFRYALPAIIAMTSASLYNIADSIFIGHGVGPLAISGLAVTFPMMNIASAFGSLIGIGASSLISIRLGQGNKQRAFLILGNAVLLNVVIGGILTAVSLAFLDPILYFFGASEHTIEYSRSYMQIILAGNVITHVYLGLNDILRATGYPRKSMAIMLTAVLSNVALDAMFVFWFGWGIRGAAVATLIGQTLALGLLIVHYTNRKHFLYFRPGIFRFVGVIVKKVVSIGLAPFLLNLCASIVVIFINTALKRYGGDLYIGAYGIVNRSVLFFIMVIAGLNQGMQPIVGYNFGARQFDRVMRALGITTVCAVTVTTFGWVLGHLFPSSLVVIFTDDPTLLKAAAEGMRLVTSVFPIVGFQVVASNFFQYIGKPKKAILLSMTRQLLFLVPLLAVLPSYYGTDGVWMSMPVADSLAALMAAALLAGQIRMFRRHPDRVKVI